MSTAAPVIDPVAISVLLCDADGNLFPSEEHAFTPSTSLVNSFMAGRGRDDRFDPRELRRATSGMNFRATISRLAEERGMDLEADELERLADREREDVTAHLASVLQPDPEVTGVLRRLSARLDLIAVSSSASPRLTACFEATGLDELFPPVTRLSAEDSLPEPASKPDPAIYLHALETSGVEADRALAIEDAAPGVASAVAAGIPTVGNLTFVPRSERAERADRLRETGACAIVDSWAELEQLLAVPVPALAGRE